MMPSSTYIRLQFHHNVHVIAVPWLARVYGICTLSAVVCIPEGAAGGNTYNCTQGTNLIHPSKATLQLTCTLVSISVN